MKRILLIAIALLLVTALAVPVLAHGGGGFGGGMGMGHGHSRSHGHGHSHGYCGDCPLYDDPSSQDVRDQMHEYRDNHHELREKMWDARDTRQQKAREAWENNDSVTLEKLRSWRGEMQNFRDEAAPLYQEKSEIRDQYREAASQRDFESTKDLGQRMVDLSKKIYEMRLGFFDRLQSILGKL
ncbi:MAG: hypothetical protein GX318_02345 [Clostridia bacterium]|nr:hypothetical protein [Clostridia bacterium]